MDDEDRLNDAIGEIESLWAEMRLDLAIQEMVQLAELLETPTPGNLPMLADFLREIDLQRIVREAVAEAVRASAMNSL